MAQKPTNDPGGQPHQESYEQGGPQHQSGLEQSQPIRRSTEPQGQKSEQQPGQPGQPGPQGPQQPNPQGPQNPNPHGPHRQDQPPKSESAYGQTTGASTQPTGRPGSESSGQTRQAGFGANPAQEAMSNAPDRATSGGNPQDRGTTQGPNWWNQIEGGWQQFRGRVREQWDRLTDDDVEQIGGRRDRLESQIRNRYGVSEDEARRQVDEWGSNLRTA